ncbi:MAG: hypothetical protein WCA76_14980, partial [Candidatus Sulfotelmatobacter sp.]
GWFCICCLRKSGNVPSVPGFSADPMLEMEAWHKRWTVAEWKAHLTAGESAIDIDALRRCTHTGRPLGTTEFVAQLEQATSRPLAPRKGGRPKKPAADAQDGFAFVA